MPTFASWHPSRGSAAREKYCVLHRGAPDRLEVGYKQSAEEQM
jgi:hypothetical protein